MSNPLAEWVPAINGMVGTSFELDDSGRLFVEFEGERRVGVEVLDDGAVYIIYTPIGLLSTAAELPRLLAAMELNLYQRETAGGVIAFDPNDGVFVYSFSFATKHASAEVLAHQLDQFAGHADRLQQLLDAALPGERDLDFEIETTRQDLGLLTGSEAAQFEAQDNLDAPATSTLSMLRV